MTRLAFRVAVLGLLFSTGGLGCGGKVETADDMTDETKVEAYLGSLTDMTENKLAFSQQFIGPPPADAELAKYAPYEFAAASAPDVSGDTCTVEVKVLKAGTTEEVGRTTWTLARKDKAWRLQSAPLP